MTQVTVSPKFQVVIPKIVREDLNLSIGTKLEVLSYNKRIELIPIKPIKSLKGALRGMDTEIVREKDRL